MQAQCDAGAFSGRHKMPHLPTGCDAWRRSDEAGRTEPGAETRAAPRERRARRPMKKSPPDGGDEKRVSGSRGGVRQGEREPKGDGRGVICDAPEPGGG